MNELLKKDQESMALILDLIKDQGLNFLNNLHKRSTFSAKEIQISRYLEQDGIGLVQALEQFNKRFEEVIVASGGPRYWGFVTGGSTPAAIAGDWLATIYDQNTQSAKGSGDVSAIIELETVKLLLSLFNLPAVFFGGFVTGATMSNFTCLAVARQWLGKQNGKDFARDGISGVVPVLSATPHSSAVKSLSMLGLGSNTFTLVKTLEGNREALV